LCESFFERDRSVIGQQYLSPTLDSLTIRKLETVRVKHKGQVTLPAKIRHRIEIKEGDLLSVDTVDGAIVLRPKKFLDPGQPVGHAEQKKLLLELEKMRKAWR
jgi:AbrB family looped-hinge helix DNA binding protein